MYCRRISGDFEWWLSACSSSPDIILLDIEVLIADRVHVDHRRAVEQGTNCVISAPNKMMRSLSFHNINAYQVELTEF